MNSITERPISILPISAKVVPALKELVGKYSEVLSADPTRQLADLGYTAGIGRTHFSERLAVLGSNYEEAQTKIESYLAGATVPGVISGSFIEGRSLTELFFCLQVKVLSTLAWEGVSTKRSWFSDAKSTIAGES